MQNIFSQIKKVFLKYPNLTLLGLISSTAFVYILKLWLNFDSCSPKFQLLSAPFILAFFGGVTYFNSINKVITDFLNKLILFFLPKALVKKYELSFFRYSLFCGLLFSFSVFWLFIFAGDLTIITVGYIFTGGLFLLLIQQMEYPKSLRSSAEVPYTLQTFWNQYKSNFWNLLRTICVGIIRGVLLALFFSLYYSFFYEFFLISSFCFAFIYIIVVCTLVLVILHKSFLKQKLKENWFLTKTEFKLSVFSKNKKLFLFFRQHSSKKSILIYYLGFSSLFSGTFFLYIPFVFYSARFHNGFEAYVWILLMFVTTYVVSLPPFRRFMFSRYGPKSFRILGWNAIETSYTKVVAAGATALALGLTVNKLDRMDRVYAVEHHRECIKIINAQNVESRLNDPVGASQGRYKEIGMEDPLPSHLQKQGQLQKTIKEMWDPFRKPPRSK